MGSERSELPDSTPEQKRRIVKQLLEVGIHNVDDLIDRLKKDSDRGPEQTQEGQ